MALSLYKVTYPGGVVAPDGIWYAIDQTFYAHPGAVETLLTLRRIIPMSPISEPTASTPSGAILPPIGIGPTGPAGPTGATGPAGTPVLPVGFIRGLELEWLSLSTFRVKAGKARDDADAADLTLGADTTVDVSTTGASGMDRKALTGTATLAGGVVTGIGTAFLTEFGTRILTGTATIAGNVVTGTGTKFLTETSLRDLFGTGPVTYIKIESIESDTQLTLTWAPAGGDIVVAQAFNVIENPTCTVVGAPTFAVTRIDDDVTMLTDSVDVAGPAAVYAGDRATCTNGSDSVKNYAVWLIGSSIYVSTQRTTPYVVAPSKRRIGYVLTQDDNNNNYGDLCRFIQSGSGATRRMEFVNDSGRFAIYGFAAPAYITFGGRVGAPPSAKRIIISGHASGVFSGTVGYTVNPRIPSGWIGGYNSPYIWSNIVGAAPPDSTSSFLTTETSCDPAQYVYITPWGTIDLFLVGYYDDL